MSREVVDTPSSLRLEWSEEGGARFFVDGEDVSDRITSVSVDIDGYGEGPSVYIEPVPSELPKWMRFADNFD